MDRNILWFGMTSVIPLVQLYFVCDKYGLLNNVNSWLDGGRLLSKHSGKEIVYKAVYTREYLLWKCLSVLYPRYPGSSPGGDACFSH